MAAAREWVVRFLLASAVALLLVVGLGPVDRKSVV